MSIIMQLLSAALAALCYVFYSMRYFQMLQLNHARIFVLVLFNTLMYNKLITFCWEEFIKKGRVSVLCSCFLS